MWLDQLFAECVVCVRCMQSAKKKNTADTRCPGGEECVLVFVWHSCMNIVHSACVWSVCMLIFQSPSSDGAYGINRLRGNIMGQQKHKHTHTGRWLQLNQTVHVRKKWYSLSFFIRPRSLSLGHCCFFGTECGGEGWIVSCSTFPPGSSVQAILFRELTDHSDECSIFVLQPLVICS